MIKLYKKLILVILFGFFTNSLLAQYTFTWKASTIDNNWSNSNNWTRSGTATGGSTSTFPGQTASTDLVVVTNGGQPNLSGITANVARLTINNAVVASGSTLTIASGASLNISSSTVTNLVINGGRIINNGALTITTTAAGSSGFPVYGINFGAPTQIPTVPTEYGITGSGTLNISINNANLAFSSAIVSSANSTDVNFANVTNKITLNNASINLNQSSTATISAIRTLAATSTNTITPKLVLVGSGLTVGSLATPSIGSLLVIGNGTYVEVGTGTTLTLNSAAANTNNALVISNAVSSLKTTLTNKGTINILGNTARSGISANTSTGVTTNPPMEISFVNDGVINVNINAVGSEISAFNVGNGGGEANSEALITITNNGTFNLINNAVSTGNGQAIWATSAGQRARTNFINSASGILNIEGTVANVARGFTVTNNGIINSNTTFSSFVALNNNNGGRINFTKSPAIFTVNTSAAASAGAIYRDSNLNNFIITTNKISNTGTRLLSSIDSINTLLETGTLTLVSGIGDATIDYTVVNVMEHAITSPFVNAGILNTGKGTGVSLSTITVVPTFSNTSTIDAGGPTEQGILIFSNPSQLITGKIAMQIIGDAVAGIDYDQITNSNANGGFDISAATLDLTNLYTPTTIVSVPVITASGTGNISGTFSSVTGLASGWSIAYSHKKVYLVYNPTATTPIVWTGAINSDFFNEGNWRDTQTNNPPSANTINPEANINLNLQINSPVTITNGGVMQFGTGRLSIGSTSGDVNISATSISGGIITINERGYLNLSSTTPLLNNTVINLTTGIGWVRIPNYDPKAIHTNNSRQIKVNSLTGIYQNTLRLDNYYLNGCVIRANLAATAPLLVFDNPNLGGASAAITIDKLHSENAIANTMNDKIESFVLRKGFMLTIAVEADGTGKSANYIASETDLVINTLPLTLNNSISFIRVMPWNWVTKKGRNDEGTDLNTSWRYRWNPDNDSTLEYEFAPMAWGHTSANDSNDIDSFIGRYNTPYIMSFNEPDDCNGQSGQYGNPKLCTISESVRLHKNLMKTGMRIVSPAGREEAPKNGQWLEEFFNEATKQDIRIDVIAVHWYDYEGNPNTNTNPSATDVFNRFKTYLSNVYNKFGLPIWITEFNANPKRSNQLNADFLAQAIPYLESLDYIERYCWYPYNTGTHFYGWDDATNSETNKILAPVGTIYKNINNATPTNSTPAVPETTVTATNNLNLVNNANVALNKPATSSSNLTTFTPAMAVDGNKTLASSRWVVDFTTSPLPAWIEIDLQGSFLVDSFQITEDVNRVKDFQFQIWDSSLHSGAGGWISVLAVTANTALATAPIVTYRTITPVHTTKVRLHVTAHNDPAISGKRMRIFELEVFGVPSSPTWTGLTDANWNTPTNWSTRFVPSSLSNVTINSGTPYQPTISSSVSIKSLSINTGASLSVSSGINLTVADNIRNDGTLTIASGSNLLQDQAFKNSGNIIINRNSNALSRFDYTIWSSPVLNSNQFLSSFSPLTVSNRFNSYNQFTNQFNTIINPSATSFDTATGYLIRMPNTSVLAPNTEVFNGVFTGIPNNGIITKTISFKDEIPDIYGFNMIGNPYPSTINADSFITQNTSKIHSSLYFWRKVNGASGTAYAVYNLLGSTATPSSPTPNGTIQVGQGFLVKAKKQTESNRYSVEFNNSMRTLSSSTQFFKTKQIEKHRLWLNLSAKSDIFSQTLIGYIKGGTSGLDDFDSVYINDSATALTSNINNEEYSIQGRSLPFDPSDIVALNFKTDKADTYNISLNNFDGIFSAGQDVFLVDLKTNIETNLKQQSYSFNAEIGTDNSRFILKYQKTLNINKSSIDKNKVRLYKKSNTLSIQSDLIMNSVKVYTIQGKLIAELPKINSKTALIKGLHTTTELLIVKIITENESTITKKIIN